MILYYKMLYVITVYYILVWKCDVRWGECGSLFELDLGCTELTRQDMSEALPPFSRQLNLNNTSHRVEQALPPGVRSIRSIQTASVCGPHRAHLLHIHLTSTSPHTPHTMTHNHLTSPHITSPHLTSSQIHPTSTSPHTAHTMIRLEYIII